MHRIQAAINLMWPAGVCERAAVSFARPKKTNILLKHKIHFRVFWVPMELEQIKEYYFSIIEITCSLFWLPLVVFSAVSRLTVNIYLFIISRSLSLCSHTRTHIDIQSHTYFHTHTHKHTSIYMQTHTHTRILSEKYDILMHTFQMLLPHRKPILFPDLYLKARTTGETKHCDWILNTVLLQRLRIMVWKYKDGRA